MSKMKQHIETSLNVVEIPMDIRFDGGDEERVVFGVVYSDAELELAEHYHNDDNIFYYVTLGEYYRLCLGERFSQEWEIVK